MVVNDFFCTFFKITVTIAVSVIYNRSEALARLKLLTQACNNVEKTAIVTLPDKNFCAWLKIMHEHASI
jgi:hypothetical protein